MDEYRISVIVPVYNVEKYLEKCVRSLINQEEGNAFWEVILIDDGSQDRSGEICDYLADKYNRIHVLHKSNGGLSSARNQGLDMATGDYVLFVDSDDYVESCTVNSLTQVLKKYQIVDAVVFDGIEENGKEQKIMRGQTSSSGCCMRGKEYLLRHYKDRKMSIEACLYLYRKEFLNNNGLRFREGILHEDVEFTPRALLIAENVVEISDKLYHYIVRSDSISTGRNKEKNIKDLFQTLKELDNLAEQQDAELRDWMKDGILNSYLNMVYDARMYRLEYRGLFDKKFLKGKAATPYNCFRANLCSTNIRLYCIVNDIYKKLKNI